MALTSCRECGSQVSDTALKCPQCAFQLRKPKRGIFGKLFKWAFILFNILMVIWIIAGLASTSDITATTDAEKAGAAIGTTLGLGFLVGIWVVGDIILGLFVLFTRPKG